VTRRRWLRRAQDSRHRSPERPSALRHRQGIPSRRSLVAPRGCGSDGAPSCSAAFSGESSHAQLASLATSGPGAAGVVGPRATHPSMMLVRPDARTSVALAAAARPRPPVARAAAVLPPFYRIASSTAAAPWSTPSVGPAIVEGPREGHDRVMGCTAGTGWPDGFSRGLLDPGQPEAGPRHPGRRGVRRVAAGLAAASPSR